MSEINYTPEQQAENRKKWVKAFEDYREKVKEKIGESKEKEVRDESS